LGQKPSKSSTKNNTAASSSRRRSPISGIIRPNLRSAVQFRSNSANPTRRNASIEIRELKSDGTVKVVASPSHGRCRRFNLYAPTITWLVRSKKAPMFAHEIVLARRSGRRLRSLILSLGPFLSPNEVRGLIWGHGFHCSVALCDQQRRENIVSCRRIFH
jgi:hypothetical protein